MKPMIQSGDNGRLNVIDAESNQYLAYCDLEDNRYYHGDDFRIWSVRVHQDYRNKCIGEWMILSSLCRAYDQRQDKQRVKVWLNVIGDNYSAVRLYEKCKFTFKYEYPPDARWTKEMTCSVGVRMVAYANKRMREIESTLESVRLERVCA